MQSFKQIHFATLLLICSGWACSDSSFTSAKTGETAPSVQSGDAKPVAAPSGDAKPVVAPSSTPVGSTPPSTDNVAAASGAPGLDASANASGTAPVPGAKAPADPAMDAVIAAIPGVAVLQVGVNFEDLRGGDADFNDAVLCFEGGFKVDDSNVVSTAKQQVIGTTFSSSSCTHQITVVIVSPDGTKSKPFIYDSKTTAQVPMSFGVGDQLEVTMVSQACDSGIVKSMHNAQDAKVLPDVCNNK